jgi:hypothetical protein
LGEGKNAKLTVREGDDFGLLAKQFVDYHCLEEDSTIKIQGLIDQTYKIHKES